MSLRGPGRPATMPFATRSRARARGLERAWARALVLAAAAIGWGDRAGAEGAPPSIVVIIADDLGWGDVGYHGSPIPTPHIDRLAAGGLRLERHYVAPTCTPTRVALLAGRYASRFGVLAPAYGVVLPRGTPTLAGALRARGYATALIGKWHMGSPPDEGPARHGFERSYGYFHGQIDPYTHRYKDGAASWHRDGRFLEEPGHATDLITQEAVRAIEAKGPAPLFLWVAYSVPHHPLDEPLEWRERARAGAARAAQPWRRDLSSPSSLLYAASVAHMDDGIGRILDALERRGLRESTLVLFLGDNGGQRRWRSRTEYGGRYEDHPQDVLGDNLPLRGWKGGLEEGGIRVPAIASWPGRIAPREAREPVHAVDWMPTLCAIAGAEPGPGWRGDGVDLRPLLRGDPTPLEPRALYWRTPEGAAVLEGGWKLIEPRGGGSPRLHDLEADPLELADRAPGEPGRVAALRASLEALARDDGPRAKP